MQDVLLGDGKTVKGRLMVGVEIEQIYRAITGDEHLSDVSPYAIFECIRIEPPE